MKFWTFAIIFVPKYKILFEIRGLRALNGTRLSSHPRKSAGRTRFSNPPPRGRSALLDPIFRAEFEFGTYERDFNVVFVEMRFTFALGRRNRIRRQFTDRIRGAGAQRGRRLDVTRNFFRRLLRLLFRRRLVDFARFEIRRVRMPHFRIRNYIRNSNFYNFRFAIGRRRRYLYRIAGNFINAQHRNAHSRFLENDYFLILR